MGRAAGSGVVALVAAFAACKAAPVRPPVIEAPADAGTPEPPPPVAQNGHVLAVVDDTAVVALDAPTFASLPREQRIAAAGLAQAAVLGEGPAVDFAYRHNLQIGRLLRGILTHPEVVPAELLARVRTYARSFWLNGGIHDAVTGRKLLPPFSAAELRTAALAARAAGADLGLEAQRLELGLRALEAPLFDPRVDAQRLDVSNFYDGLPPAEAPPAPRFVRTTRLNGAVTQTAPNLTRIADALDLLPQAQKPEMLIGFLRTGDPERLKAVEKAWTASPGEIESAFDFFDTSADPLGEKALFGAVVGAREGDAHGTVAALVLLGSGGASRPMRDFAVSVAGARTLVFRSALLEAARAGYAQAARELAPPDQREQFARCWGTVQAARLALGASDLRADAAADAIAQDASSAWAFAAPSCQPLYPQIVAASWLAAAADAADDGTLGTRRLRNAQVEAYWFSARGALTERHVGGKRYLYADPSRFAEAAFELQKLLDDPARAKELYDQHGARTDLAWHDEIAERLRTMPRHVVAVPPRLEAQPDGKASAVDDLDAEVLRVLQAL